MNTKALRNKAAEKLMAQGAALRRNDGCPTGHRSPKLNRIGTPTYRQNEFPALYQFSGESSVCPSARFTHRSGYPSFPSAAHSLQLPLIPCPHPAHDFNICDDNQRRRRPPSCGSADILSKVGETKLGRTVWLLTEVPA
jgi:hypothetical protein